MTLIKRAPRTTDVYPSTVKLSPPKPASLALSQSIRELNKTIMGPKVTKMMGQVSSQNVGRKRALTMPNKMSTKTIVPSVSGEWMPGTHFIATHSARASILILVSGHFIRANLTAEPNRHLRPSSTDDILHVKVLFIYPISPSRLVIGNPNHQTI
jgi:hypothetical protein